MPSVGGGSGKSMRRLRHSCGSVSFYERFWGDGQPFGLSKLRPANMPSPCQFRELQFINKIGYLIF